jgi:asparagine synthase (glutamine-hydrolysing)
LKKAISGVIPDEIINRPKQGFAVPVTEWLQKELGDAVRKRLMDFAKEQPYFESDEIERLLGKKNSALPWYLFNFALWHDAWIEQKVLEPALPIR